MPEEKANAARWARIGIDFVMGRREDQ